MSRRPALCLAVSLVAGVAGLSRLPFPGDNPLLELVRVKQPVVFYVVQSSYLAMLFTTPYIACSVLSSLGFIFWSRSGRTAPVPAALTYPDPSARLTLSLVVGEIHHAKRPEPAAEPRWLTLPERGLYTGIAVFGATGSGKTSGCMHPFAQQLLAYRAHNHDERMGGLVLEVKGDFCHSVRAILEKLGRCEDYLEVGLDSDVCYNPLENDLDAYALAYGIASLLNNLFGKSREPFWQQAYTNLIKFVILLHKVLDDYVTLFDVYQGAINPDYLERRIQEGDERLAGSTLAISFDDFMSLRALENYPFERDVESDRMVAPATEELRRLLDTHGVRCLSVADAVPWTDERRHQFDAIKRWFYQDWLRIDARLRTSIVEGVSVFLSLFDDPKVKRLFCPPKQAYAAGADGLRDRTLPPFGELIERGIVCALNFPVSANPGLARTIGTLMKQDFQRAVLNRIPKMAHEPGRLWRQVLFLCDEYHAFATVGENDPSGDEKFFALSRQARCIPIVATHSISSLRSTLPGETWRTLLQTFRTKVFLALSDDFSARTASELCGKEEQLKPHYTISEQGQDAGISIFTGRATAHRAGISATKGYNVQRDFVFEPKVFMELKNAQAIVLAYDGVNPWPPTYCYLKPHYLNPNVSYFDHLRRGAL